MIDVQPITLERGGIRLEPLAMAHCEGLQKAVADGALWNIWVVKLPRPEDMEAHIQEALKEQGEGHRLPWAVREMASGEIIGSTSYHDIVPNIDRVEIGHTWYAASRQRSKVNTLCKFMLLNHAFDTLGCKLVGWRTDAFNFRSQRAIEALGAKRDGVLRHHRMRGDGSVRDTVMYSMLASEWPDARKHLEARLQRHAQAAPTEAA